MLCEPINDEKCLGLAMRDVWAAMGHAHVRALAEMLGTLRHVVLWLRSLPQQDDGPDDTTPGPRIACDVLQRVRIPARNPNCLERALLYLALAELIDPRLRRYLMTITIHGPRGSVRHTFPVENGRPVNLDPVISTHTLAAGLHLATTEGRRSMRNAGVLSALDSLRWVVDAVGQVVNNKDVQAAVKHSQALQDVARIARGVLPVDLDTLAWAVTTAVPLLVPYGTTGVAALKTAAALVDDIQGASSSSVAKPSKTKTLAA